MSKNRPKSLLTNCVCDDGWGKDQGEEFFKAKYQRFLSRRTKFSE